MTKLKFDPLSFKGFIPNPNVYISYVDNLTLTKDGESKTRINMALYTDINTVLDRLFSR